MKTKKQKPKAAKPVLAWACIRRNGEIHPGLIFRTREEAKAGWDWSVARVRIAEVRR